MFLCLASLASAQEFVDEFRWWPKETSPVEIGDILTDRLIEANSKPDAADNHLLQFHLSVAAAWFGALEYAEITDNKELREDLQRKFQVYWASVSNPTSFRDRNLAVYGGVLLKLYLQTHMDRYLDEGLMFIEEAHKRNKIVDARTAVNVTAEDLFVNTFLQVQAYRATSDTIFLTRACRMMVTCIEALQRPTGFFYRSADSPFHWGLANGWAAAGLTQLLSILPGNHRYYKQISQSYHLLLASSLAYQAGSGMWRQVYDDFSSREEPAVTGFIAYAMTTGVKKGWLLMDAYGPVARRGWLGLVTQIEKDGFVDNVTAFAEEGSSKQYYLDLNNTTTDIAGAAAALWCAYALMLDQSEKGVR